MVVAAAAAAVVDDSDDGDGCYDTRKFGAENKTDNVAMIVNSVKMIRHKRSTTIAANFQSRVTSLLSSSLRS